MNLFEVYNALPRVVTYEYEWLVHYGYRNTSITTVTADDNRTRNVPSFRVCGAEITFISIFLIMSFSLREEYKVPYSTAQGISDSSISNRTSERLMMTDGCMLA
ncbi:hypothetical protein J6590_062689 [Homalodisca vitripennis]|nr:hypothetical protein J6590_062689 [Homalodisca vitripennis]